MSIDLSQFHDVFFEESFEGLEIMENELLHLDYKNPGDEEINKIFRAAHSIKGGSGSFGFSDITNFTHVLETLLDEVRAGKHQLNQEEVNLLLTSVDCLREMLSAAKDNNSYDEAHIEEIQKQLEKALGNENQTDDSSETEAEQSSFVEGWEISFAPYVNLYQTGNDPLRMFRELEEMGELSVEVNIDNIPPFIKHDFEECYLSWNLMLKGDVSKEQVVEVFEWVEDECDLSITAIASEKPVQSEDTSAEVVKEVKPVEEKRTEERRKTERRNTGNSESSSIRVNIDKIDALINMVGELVITQSMLGQFGEEFDVKNIDKLNDGLKQLERNTRELQENVMQIRMLPISFSFNRFPRLVHDLSSKLNKKIELKLSGESTELDKTVMEKIGDPLVHLVRNSLDHGIEMPEERVAAGKPETGTIHLNAYHEGGNIVIEIEDDGAGLNTKKIHKKAIERGILKEGETLSDHKINELIFHAGFSTADVVSDVSGRGVGMDVVKRNINDLGGVVEVKSEKGKGSVFTIRLPLTLAILDGQLIRVGDQTYIIPLISIIESLQINETNMKSIASDTELYRLREDYIPILRLHDLFNIECDNTNLNSGLLVVVEAEGQKVGLFVDDLLAQQQVVIKSLETNYKKVEGLSGATILGDGTVAMILDISNLIEIHKERESNKKSLINDEAA